jgi:hypothetical protein
LGSYDFKERENEVLMATSKELYTNILPHAMAAYIGKSSDVESAKQMAHALASEMVNECARMGLLEDVRPQVQSPSEGMGMVTPQMVAAVASGTPAAVGTQGLARFVAPEQQGNSPGGVVPVGAPHQPAQHYNVTGGYNGNGHPQPAPAAAPAAPWYPPHLAHLHQPQAPSAAPVAGPGGVPIRYPAAQAQVALGEGSVAAQRAPYDVGGTMIVPSAGETFVPPAQAGVMNHVVQVPTPQGHSALGTEGVIAQPAQRPNNQDVIVAPANQSVITQAGGSGTTFVPERIVR